MWTSSPGRDFSVIAGTRRKSAVHGNREQGWCHTKSPVSRVNTLHWTGLHVWRKVMGPKSCPSSPSGPTRVPTSSHSALFAGWRCSEHLPEQGWTGPPLRHVVCRLLTLPDEVTTHKATSISGILWNFYSRVHLMDASKNKLRLFCHKK